MSQVCFPDEPEFWRSTTITTRRDGDPFIRAANLAAGWLFDIVGPFFWGSLIAMFILAGMTPH